MCVYLCYVRFVGLCLRDVLYCLIVIRIVMLCLCCSPLPRYCIVWLCVDALGLFYVTYFFVLFCFVLMSFVMHDSLACCVVFDIFDGVLFCVVMLPSCFVLLRV